MQQNYTFTLLLVSLFLFMLNRSTNAQNLSPCATDMPEEMLDWLKEFRQNPIDYKKNKTAIDYIPIQFHIVGDDEGVGYFAASEVFRLLCETNDQWGDVGMQFYNYSRFNYLDNSSYYAHDFGTGFSMMSQNNYDDVVNVYIVSDPAGACGYFTGGADGIAVAKSCSGPASTTLSHELGHFFAMPHTFSGWEGGDPGDAAKERVDGSNCASTGDFFCDTPADYIADRWTCPYVGNLTDPAGVPIDPDESLFMSYALDRCTSRFSPQQMQAIVSFLYNQRNNLVQTNPPPVTPVADTDIMYPGNGAKEVFNEHVLLTWQRASGATEYYVEVEQYIDVKEGTNVRVYTTDTFLVAKLDANIDYFWKVQPLNAGNTCAIAGFGSFTTSDATNLYIEDMEVTALACEGDNEGSVFLNVTGGQSPYTFAWDTGETGARIHDLTAGIYTVTVTDAVANSQTFKVKVPEPEPVTATFRQTDNFTAELNINGGAPPYTVAWPDGSDGTNGTNLEVGENQVMITDANGCTEMLMLGILAIQTNVQQISCAGANDGSINIELGGGVPPYRYNWDFDSELGEETNTVSNLLPGVYTVRIQDSENANIYLSIEINDVQPLETSIATGIGNATAIVAGGVPPYTYYWPTGPSSSPTVENLPAGIPFEVVIYDANNCEIKANFEITIATNIEELEATSQNWTFYPTILTNNQQLNLVAKTTINDPVHIQIFDNSGRLLHQEQRQFIGGQQQIEINHPILTTGMYLIHIQTPTKKQTNQFIIIE